MIPKLAVGLIVAPLFAFVLATIGFEPWRAALVWFVGSVWWIVVER